jgi:hypothetical protein
MILNREDPSRLITSLRYPMRKQPLPSTPPLETSRRMSPNCKRYGLGSQQKRATKEAEARAKVEQEAKGLQVQLMEAEERLLESRKTQERLQNESQFYKEESEKCKTKNGVLEQYASDLQRKIDTLNLDLKDRSEDLEKIKVSDWTKRLMDCNALIEQMRQQLLDQERQHHELKSQLSAAVQAGGSNKKHFETFIEEQSKELLKARKIVSGTRARTDRGA